MSSDDYSGARIVYLLEGMFVVLPARRRGHGQQLIEAAVDHVREEAKKLNVSKASIVLRTSQAVTSARLFYEEMGFEAREEVVTASLPYTVMMLNFDLSMPE
jgi:GNAT superfamily N-acetyltransferase